MADAGEKEAPRTGGAGNMNRSRLARRFGWQTGEVEVRDRDGKVVSPIEDKVDQVSKKGKQKS